MLVEAWTDAEIAKFTAVPPDTSVAYATKWIAGVRGREIRRLAIDRAIVFEGSVVGEVGVSSFDEKRQAALAGYWISAEHRGRGLATEALQIFAEFAFATLGLTTLLAEIGVENIASIRAAKAAGFTTLREADPVVLVLRQDRNDR